MAFKEYNEIADPLVLPINGKSYTIPAVGIASGIRLTEGLEPGSDVPMSDDEFKKIILGTALDEMIADDVPGPAVVRAALTALADFQRGRTTAEIMWLTGGDPKEIAAWAETQGNRATRRTTTTPRTGTGKASTTKRRASGTTTKTSHPS